jgi:hypothetical protein
MIPDDFDVDKLAVDGKPVFLLRGLVVRYNPGRPGVNITEEGTSLGGVLGLEGFDKTNGGVLGCVFIHDDDLVPGTMVLSPKR